MKKLNNVLLVFVLLVSSVVYSAEVQRVTTIENPVKVIQSTIVKLNQLTTATIYSPQMMGFLVEQEITPLFDFEHIATEVLSISRINLGEEETEFFANRIKKNVINTLISKLARSHTGSFYFVSARPTIQNNIIVRLSAKGYSRFALNLDLFFHQSKSGKWQIFDVALGHDSLVNYYQRVVRSKVRRYGVYGMLGRI
ncbi:ABC transporter substrate-binding protein [Bathymodiolus septemdierum thioautotrophic gill symbiont]|uniref:Putative toluene tolerance protein n=1 Tax=endosymbiont of Bathymodiolus septemdierum str. Myojin knoll TaxID=1303921 RepID=A0A0P0URC2_9GAMM|nr:ABC transporter substrate-binding protein [Bathymodiolus septemdierum thioautotrophic gill symbiont]BAS67772.1 putative toluene tolerance protein [endosymbiont of Bathymodiolus septemdierum str. Myojin knoll]